MESELDKGIAYKDLKVSSALPVCSQSFKSQLMFKFKYFKLKNILPSIYALISHNVLL